MKKHVYEKLIGKRWLPSWGGTKEAHIVKAVVTFLLEKEKMGTWDDRRWADQVFYWFKDTKGDVQMAFHNKLGIGGGMEIKLKEEVGINDVIDALELVSKDIMVEDCHGHTIPTANSRLLGDSSEFEDLHAWVNDCKYDDYAACWMLKTEAEYVIGSGLHFSAYIDRPEDIYWSEPNDGWVDINDDYTHYGYISDGGDEGYFYNSDAASDGNDWYFDDCVAESHGLRYRHGEWRRRDGDEDYNAEYHNLERTYRLTENTVFGIGFEIEKEDEDAYEGVAYWGLYEETKWIKEDDSSLDDNGYELVTPAYDLFTNDLDKDIEKNNDLKLLINADHTINCGGHLTFSSSEYTSNELLEGLSGFIPIIYALYQGRMENEQGYCEPQEKWRYHNIGGRRAVNLRPNRTCNEAGNKVFGAVEFRVFSAVRSVNNLLWRRDLMRIIAKHINSSEKQVLRMLMSPSSLLFKHLIKVYTVDRIIEKIRLFVAYSQTYNNMKLKMPDLEAIRKKLNKSTKDNNSTNELGA